MTVTFPYVFPLPKKSLLSSLSTYMVAKVAELADSRCSLRYHNSEKARQRFLPISISRPDSSLCPNRYAERQRDFILDRTL
jgi:hypothetical protein